MAHRKTGPDSHDPLISRWAGVKLLGDHRVARAAGWGLLAGALAAVVAAVVPTRLEFWQLVAIGTSLGASLDSLGLMPSACRRKLVTTYAKHDNQLVENGLISEAQRRQQIDALLRNHGP